MEHIFWKKNLKAQIQTILKRILKSAPTSGKLTGISICNSKTSIFKELNVSFIVHVCLSKYFLNITNAHSCVCVCLCVCVCVCVCEYNSTIKMLLDDSFII